MLGSSDCRRFVFLITEREVKCYGRTYRNRLAVAYVRPINTMAHSVHSSLVECTGAANYYDIMHLAVWLNDAFERHTSFNAGRLR